MEKFFAVLGECLEKPFTRRRLWRFLAGFAVFAFGVFTYESYTAAFRLERLRRTAELLAQIQHLEVQGTNGSAEFQHAKQVLLDRTSRVVDSGPKFEWVPLTLSFSLDSLWKFLVGSVLWQFVCLAQSEKWKTKAGRRDIGYGVGMGVAAGIGAALVPAIWWPWFHLLIYPCLFVGAGVVVVIPIMAVQMGIRKASKRAEEINCILNLRNVGLAARTWATEANTGLLPRDISEIKKYLEKSRIVCCPANGKRPYELLTPGASEADPNIAYAKCPVHDLVLLSDGSVHRRRDARLVGENGALRLKPRNADSASGSGGRQD